MLDRLFFHSCQCVLGLLSRRINVILCLSCSTMIWKHLTVSQECVLTAHYCTYSHIQTGTFSQARLWNDHGTLWKYPAFHDLQAINVPSLTQSMWRFSRFFISPAEMDLSIIVCFERTDKSVRRWSGKKTSYRGNLYCFTIDNKHAYQPLKHFDVNIWLHSSVIW